MKGSKRKPSESREKRPTTGVGSGLPRVPPTSQATGSGYDSAALAIDPSLTQETPDALNQTIHRELAAVGKGKGKQQGDSHTSHHHSEVKDELRGMGLDMGMGNGSGSGPSDTLTNGMGFGDSFWTSSFGNNTSMATPIADPSMCSISIPRVLTVTLDYNIF